MRMNQKVALIASAGLGMVFLAACSDSATAPASSKFVSDVSLAVGALTNNTPQVGVIKICKAGNAGGSFDVTRTAVGASTGLVSGLNTLIATGECRIAAEDNGPDGVGSNVTIVEDAAANTVSSVTGCVFIGGAPPVIDGIPCAFNPGARFVNQFHGYVVTYTNTFTPPPPPGGCTYTKGWYRNNGSDDVVAVDGRTANEARAIFDATPGKPGDVTWQGDNNTLNLYQQLLAAILNGGLTSGVTSVVNAINAALAATGEGATPLSITLVAGSDVGALIAPLANFNEGNVANFPHCE